MDQLADKDFSKYELRDTFTAHNEKTHFKSFLLRKKIFVIENIWLQNQMYRKKKKFIEREEFFIRKLVFSSLKEKITM
jgi:hypothetical protein